MSKAQPSTQSPTERRAAEAELRELIARYAPAYDKLVGTLRRQLQKRLPTAHELVYEYKDAFVISYSPNEHGYEGVLAIRATADGVQLYFNQGKELPDPEKLLKGSGKQTRMLDVESASTLRKPAAAKLLDEAIARTPVPFAATGRGPLVIRSTTAQKRRKA